MPVYNRKPHMLSFDLHGRSNDFLLIVKKTVSISHRNIVTDQASQTSETNICHVFMFHYEIEVFLKL